MFCWYPDPTCTRPLASSWRKRVVARQCEDYDAMRKRSIRKLPPAVKPSKPVAAKRSGHT